MRLLVTRPEPDAERTAAALRALGHTVVVQPLLAVTFADPPVDLARPATIAVTSQNGVRALGRWPQASEWHNLPLFAAGPATARAASALGFRDVRVGDGDAGSLVDVILERFPKGAGPVLYPAARERAGALAGGLTALGYDVRTVEAYRADPVTRFDEAVRISFAAGSIEGVLLYSRRTAMALRDLAAAEGLTSRLSVPTFYVISGQVAAVLAGIARRIEVSGHPDEDSLFALVPRPR